MATPKWVEFDLHIDLDGKIVHEDTSKEEGADCRVVTKYAAGFGSVVSDETTGPFCDKQNERT